MSHLVLFEVSRTAGICCSACVLFGLVVGYLLGYQVGRGEREKGGVLR